MYVYILGNHKIYLISLQTDYAALKHNRFVNVSTV